MPKDWDSHKAELEQLYIVERRSLKQVQEHLKDQHGFIASTRAYRMRLDDWGLRKNKSSKQHRVYKKVSRKPSHSVEPICRTEAQYMRSKVSNQTPSLASELEILDHSVDPDSPSKEVSQDPKEMDEGELVLRLIEVDRWLEGISKSYASLQFAYTSAKAELERWQNGSVENHRSKAMCERTPDASTNLDTVFQHRFEDLEACRRIEQDLDRCMGNSFQFQFPVGYQYSFDQKQARTMGSSSSSDCTRGVDSRPVPVCWEHGCTGRSFATSGDLLRHQSEIFNAVAKSTCADCDAKFTKSSVRNYHMANGLCMGQNDQ